MPHLNEGVASLSLSLCLCLSKWSLLFSNFSRARALSLSFFSYSFLSCLMGFVCCFLPLCDAFLFSRSSYLSIQLCLPPLSLYVLSLPLDLSACLSLPLPAIRFSALHTKVDFDHIFFCNGAVFDCIKLFVFFGDRGVPWRNALSLSQQHHECCCCSLRKAQDNQGRVYLDYNSQNSEGCYNYIVKFRPEFML